MMIKVVALFMTQDLRVSVDLNNILNVIKLPK